MMKRFWVWTPLAVFMVFAVVVASGLIAPSSRVVASKMIGKRVPNFRLPPALAGQAHVPGLNVPGLGAGSFYEGRPKLLNIFASWCIPCAAEAPVLLELKRRGVIIDAIAIRDKPVDVARFLKRYGNPYARIGSDVNSAVQISLGSSGVPESFVVDGKGIIRYQHVGDIRKEDIPDILEALGDAR